MIEATIIENIDRLMDVARVTRVVSIDDMYYGGVNVAEVGGLVVEVGPAVAKAVFGTGEGIDFDGEPDVVLAQLQRAWARFDPGFRSRIFHELRSNTTPRGKIDWSARVALGSCFGKYEFRPLSLAEWRAQQDQLVNPAKERTLLLFDEDFSGEPGGTAHTGLQLVKEVLAIDTSEDIICGLLSHNYTMEDVHDAWQHLCQHEGLDPLRFVLIPKESVDREPLGFGRLIKLTVLNSAAQKLKVEASKVLTAACDAAIKLLSELDIYDFDQIVFRSSNSEGVWEPDTLFRVFHLFHRDEIRKLAKTDRALNELADDMRRISLVPMGTSAVPNARTWFVQRLEMYEDEQALNSHLMPLELGDIIQKTGASSKRFIILGQPCELMVRTNGKRDGRVSEVTIAEIVPWREGIDPTSHFELRFFEKGQKYYVAFKDTHIVNLCVLDLCCFNQDGASRITVTEKCPPGVIPAWQARYQELCEIGSKLLNRYARLATLRLQSPQINVLLLRSSHDNVFSGSADPGNHRITYNVKRVGRLRSARAGALLNRYFAFLGREAFDHELTRGFPDS
ncbi:MAG: hypothetical protein ABSD96_20505 [Candidatus Korobacteraceae bacterium]